jgi:hypothetical protein
MRPASEHIKLRRYDVDPNHKEVVEKILGRIGSFVKFKYPGNEGDKHGVLKDRAVIYSAASTEVPYWDFVDLIEFAGEPEKEWIRIGYYRKPKERLVYGSQTTITEPITVWKDLLIHAAREKPWFKKLLDDVMVELKK